MKRVHEAHRLAPALRADGDESLALERLEHAEAGHSLQLAEPDGFTQRQHLEHVRGRGVEWCEAGLDHLAKSGRST